MSGCFCGFWNSTQSPCLQGTCFTIEPAPQPTPRGSGGYFCDTYPSDPDHKSLRDSSMAILHNDVLHSCPSSSDRCQHSVPCSLISHPRSPHWTFTVVTGYTSFLWWVVRLHLYHLYSKPTELLCSTDWKPNTWISQTSLQLGQSL